LGFDECHDHHLWAIEKLADGELSFKYFLKSNILASWRSRWAAPKTLSLPFRP
jgi:hypothetical protein